MQSNSKERKKMQNTNAVTIRETPRLRTNRAALDRGARAHRGRPPKCAAWQQQNDPGAFPNEEFIFTLVGGHSGDNGEEPPDDDSDDDDAA